jgi:hypothetical protein
MNDSRKFMMSGDFAKGPKQSNAMTRLVEDGLVKIIVSTSARTQTTGSLSVVDAEEAMADALHEEAVRLRELVCYLLLKNERLRHPPRLDSNEYTESA